MERRDLLRAFGAATALALLPTQVAEAWAQVAAGVAPTDGLTDAQLATVARIADTILPRTDTPSATDVGVPAFVNVIVGENYTDTERAAFAAGVDALSGVEVAVIEAKTDRRLEPARTYWRLKDLIIHGYFTSEPVMKSVLHYEVMPGRFEGSAPMPKARRS